MELKKPFARFFKLLELDRRDILYILLFAIFVGIINLSLPLGIQAIIGLIMVGQMSTSWIILVSVVLVGISASGFVQILQLSMLERIQQRIFARSALEFSFRIPRFKVETLLNNHPPELINRFFDTLTIQKSLPKILLEFSTATLQIVFGLILLSFYHPVFVVFGVVLLALILVIFKFTGSKGLMTSLKESKRKYDVAHWLEEVARTMDTFKLAGRTDLPWKKTDRLVGDYLNDRRSHFRVLLTQYGAMVAFKVLVTGGLLLLGGALIFDRQINIGQFVAAEIVILLIINSVEKIILQIDTAYDLLTGLEKVGQVFDLPLEKTEGFNTLPTGSSHGLSVRLEKVSVAGENGAPMIKEVSLDIQSGVKMMLRGKNGSGKSVLLNILAGLYEDYTGRIHYNDTLLSSLNRIDLRSVIGDNLFDEDIFEGTLFENLTMGREGITEKEVHDRLEQVGLKDFVLDLDRGIHTSLIPQGRDLSRSTVKRILFVRSLLGNPKMILMDDPTSGLDAESQECILRCIMDLKEVTVVISSADERIAERVDAVVELENGSIKTGV